MLDETKRDKILQASLEEFAEYGYEKASTDRISQRAEVSKGLIFHYFGSKSKLYMITINNCIDDMFEEYKNVKTDNMDFIGNIKLLMKIKYDFFNKNPLYYRIMLNGFYNSPAELKCELQNRYYELSKIGMGIIADMISNLQLKKGVSIDNVITVISGIQNILENKYLYRFTNDTASFEGVYTIVSDEFMNLLNIVMYGIIDEK
ncbi:MAG: transcriptional regulator, TetR family [Sedimentibacter sp.]|jgi:TetR/AcrR family transcriptional regulator|nr:transcriptional regulator, TetR family [Sedimentibacter sp.]